jgi:predicted MFS family arabinose efflux permease
MMAIISIVIGNVLGAMACKRTRQRALWIVHMVISLALLMFFDHLAANNTIDPHIYGLCLVSLVVSFICVSWFTRSFRKKSAAADSPPLP